MPHFHGYTLMRYIMVGFALIVWYLLARKKRKPMKKRVVDGKQYPEKVGGGG